MRRKTFDTLVSVGGLLIALVLVVALIYDYKKGALEWD